MKKYFAEFLGTLFFVFVVIASGDVLAIGAALAIVTSIIGGISGGHVNPAVTLAIFVKGNLPRADLLPYILAQVAGGFAAVELNKLV